MNANLLISNQMLNMANQMATEWLHKSIARVVEVSDCEVGEYSDKFSIVWAGEYTLEVTHITEVEAIPDYEWAYEFGRDIERFVGVDYEAIVEFKNIDVKDENGNLVASNVQFDEKLINKIGALIEEAARIEAEEAADNYDPY